MYSTLDGAKLKNTKFSSGGLGGEFAKICTSENFPLYGMTISSLISPIFYTAQFEAKSNDANISGYHCTSVTFVRPCVLVGSHQKPSDPGTKSSVSLKKLKSDNISRGTLTTNLAKCYISVREKQRSTSVLTCGGLKAMKEQCLWFKIVHVYFIEVLYKAWACFICWVCSNSLLMLSPLDALCINYILALTFSHTSWYR